MPVPQKYSSSPTYGEARVECGQGVTERKINGCVAMVMAADSRAYRHVVLKQNKSKMSPGCPCCLNSWTVGARTLRKAGRGRAKPRLQSSVHCPESLATICILPAQIPGPVSSRGCSHLGIFSASWLAMDHMLLSHGTQSSYRLSLMWLLHRTPCGRQTKMVGL